MNLKQMLEKAAERYADKTAIVMGERRLSYAELDEASNKVANALLGMGIGKGDRIAMLHEGTVVEVSNPHTFLQSEHPVVRGFLDSQHISRNFFNERQASA